MITLRIPTKDQYAFVEVQVGADDAETAKKEYDKYIQTFQSENKYSETTFNEMISKIMDSDITEWQIGADDYQYLTESQQKVMQSIKRFRKRLPEEIE